jgi:hypothetical protein
MSSREQNVFDDEYLVRYLIGALPPEETERLDEMSVAHDDFAWRLRGVENDLVDSYARSELSGETLRQFTSFYLTSSRRRKKVEFAEGLRRFHARSATVSEAAGESARKRAPLWGRFPSHRINLQFALSAALAILLLAGYLLVENARLRREATDARIQSSSADQHVRDLEKQLNEQRRSSASRGSAEQGTKSAPDIGQLKMLSLLLPPPTRGLSSIKNVTIYPDTDLLVLLLTLESVNHRRFRVTLKDPVTNGVVWSSSELEPVSVGEKKAVSVAIPARLLKQQNYNAEIVGLPQGSMTWIVGDYPFHVVLR